jgi:hypothetical protein
MGCGVAGGDVTRDTGRDVTLPRDVSVSVGVPGRGVLGKKVAGGVSEGVAGCDVSERTEALSVTEEDIERLGSVGVSGLPSDISVSVGVPGRDVAGEGSSGWTSPRDSCILSPAAWAEALSVTEEDIDCPRSVGVSGLEVTFPRDMSVSVGV